MKPDDIKEEAGEPGEDIDKLKLAIAREQLLLDQERVAIERDRAEREGRFLNKNLGVILTTIVSLVAVFVSVLQYKTASTQKDRELELADKQLRLADKQSEHDQAAKGRDQAARDHEVDIAERRENREKQTAEERENHEWKQQALQYVTENRDALLGSDPNESKRFLDVLRAVFPAEIVEPIARGLATVAPTAQKAQLEKVQAAAFDQIQPRVYIGIVRDDQRRRAQEIQNLLETQGFPVPYIRQVHEPTPHTEVRFYRNEGAKDAQKLVKILRENGVSVDDRKMLDYEKAATFRPRHYDLRLGDDFLGN